MKLSRVLANQTFCHPIIEVVALLLPFTWVSGAAIASANSSWVQQPAWAEPIESNSPPTSSRPRRTYYSQDSQRSTPTSPFAPGSNNLAIDVGQVFLMGDLGNQYTNNIGGQLHYTYGVSDLFGFDSSAGYSEHSNGKYSMMTLLAGLRTNLSWYDKIVPYLVFGLGFYRPSYSISGTTTNTGSTSIAPVLFGVHLGPGVDLALSRQLFFGAAITFHDAFGDRQLLANGQSMDVGGTFTTFFLHVGYTF